MRWVDEKGVTMGKKNTWTTRSDEEVEARRKSDAEGVRIIKKAETKRKR